MPDETNNPNPAVPGGDAASAPDAQQPREMDAANASLGNALAVSFTVLRVVMLLLIVVFLFSGCFTVRQDEVAIRTRFGRIIPDGASEVLTAERGPYFRWPSPVGEVYRIPTRSRSLNLDEPFVYNAARGRNASTPLASLGGAASLDPAMDGSLLTADKNIVHARYRVRYEVRPADAVLFVRHLAAVGQLDRGDADPELIFADADKLVRSAVEQAIVADVASTPLDRFLLGGANLAPAATTPTTPAGGATTPPAGTDPASDATGEQGAAAEQGAQDPAAAPDAGAANPPADAQQPPVAQQPAAPTAQEQSQIRVKAQEILTRLQTGITILEVQRTDQDVLAGARFSIDQVNRNVQYRAQKISEETGYRNAILEIAAGKGFPAVLAVIDVYEEALRQRATQPALTEQAERAMTAMFEGQPLKSVLEPLAEALPEDHPQRARLQTLAQTYGQHRLQGDAANIVDRADQRAASYVAQLQADADEFEGLLASYRQNAELVRQSLFNQTLRRIFSSESAETDYITPGSELRVLLNRDPEAEQAEEQRRRGVGQPQQPGGQQPSGPPPAPQRRGSL